MTRRTRRRPPAEEAGAGMERWLLTYADMITLLLALFIVLYALSVVNEQKLAALRASLQGAFAGKVEDGGESILNSGAAASTMELDTVTDNRIDPIQPLEHTATHLARLERANRELAQLRDQVEQVAASRHLSASVEARVDGRGLVVRVLSDDVLFDVGQADLKTEAKALLGPIARLLRAKPNGVRVEGHTDSTPIHTLRFRSNWELSTARATSVVHYLIQAGIRAPRLSAAGFAAEHPIAPNASAPGRARNRRIEIVILRPDGLQA